jgi:hypothetical protein
MKKIAFVWIVGLGFMASACAGRVGPAQSAGSGVHPVNSVHPTGFWRNGTASNRAAVGAVTFNGVELVDGQLVRR